MRAFVVRLAEPSDVETLVQLCAEHAAFERAPYEAEGKSVGLRAALFAASPRLQAWVATVGNEVIGYATATEEFSTWNAAPFIHMDCLFVRSGHRNSGIGAALLIAVTHHARERGLTQVQWQTPAWNTDACRFYQRHGATARTTTRFCVSVIELWRR
jgi:GNAT superfamily N-acetyltransferase